MKPAPFHYVRPQSVTEALDLLAAPGATARVLAGGQTLVPLLVRRLERPASLVDINGLGGLDRIEVTATHIRMGALVRQEQARRSEAVREYAAGVAEALAWVANPVVRQRGTVVGNLVTNSPGAELPAVAMALQAQFVVRDPDGEHTVQCEALLGHKARGGGPLPPGTLVTQVLWPRRKARAGFYEAARRDGHAPVVSAMVSWNDGDCRVALSGVCAVGLSCANTAQLIARRFPHVPPSQEVLRVLREDIVHPMHGDAYCSAQYRLDVAPEIIRRAALRMAGSPS